VDPITIPQRALFKASEVCELLRIQPYVLRSWENEFKDLGVAKTPGGPRTYRRGDVERAMRIRQLVFVEGLTLAGARRRMEQENSHTPTPEDESFAAAAAAIAASGDAERALAPGPAASLEPAVAIPPPPADSAVRATIDKARSELRALLALLGGTPSMAAPAGHPAESTDPDFTLAAPARKRRASKTT
jgi:DNA-binding transcriptional MerR regulator